MKIGVFDSGVGGKSVAVAIEKALPQHQIIFKNDARHLPYGTKSPDEILGYVLPILEGLQAEGCQVIVIACNTATTTLIEPLRTKLNVPLVAVEPMIKPAAELTKTKTIAVCATPTTLASPRYQYLKDIYAQGVTVIEPDCSQWTMMIEADTLDRDQIHERIDAACRAGADVIVLGCTHYHWIEDIITQEAAGRAIVIQPEAAVVAQLQRVLADLSDQ